MANHPTWKHESPRANRNIATVGGIIGAGKVKEGTRILFSTI